MEKLPYKYTHKEMQENLPDYAFGRLDTEQKAIFERTLPDFPDILKELNEVQKLFSRVEAMDYDSYLSRRSRNLSVKVNDAMQPPKLIDKFSKVPLFVAPGALLAIILIMIFVPYDKSYDYGIADKSKEYSRFIEKTKISDSEILAVIAEADEPSEIIESENDILESVSMVEPVYKTKEVVFSDAELNVLYQELFASIPDNDLEETSNYDLKSYPGYSGMIYSEVENLEEDEFISLLEELHDVHI